MPAATQRHHNCPWARYWVLSDAKVDNKRVMWNEPVDVRGGEKSVTLDERNAKPIDETGTTESRAARRAASSVHGFLDRSVRSASPLRSSRVTDFFAAPDVDGLVPHYALVVDLRVAEDPITPMGNCGVVAWPLASVVAMPTL